MTKNDDYSAATGAAASANDDETTAAIAASATSTLPPPSSITIVVVGQNKPRLVKIMSLVKELEDTNNAISSLSSLPPSSSSSSLPPLLSHSYVPCLAALDSYENQQGKTVSYLSHLVAMTTTTKNDALGKKDDNNNDSAAAAVATTTTTSPMTKYLDDDHFRQSLRLVVLVGYEWRQDDEDDDMRHIRSYFAAANLLTKEDDTTRTVAFQCVQPNNIVRGGSGNDVVFSFASLQEEMQYFKDLSDEEKALQCSKQELGPWRMARFVVNSAQEMLQKERQYQEVLKVVKDDDDLQRNESAFQGSKNDRSENETCDMTTTTVAAAAAVVPAAVSQVTPPPQNPTLRIDPTRTIFACRICRTPLLDESHLADGHEQNLHSFHSSKQQQQPRSGISNSSSSSSACQSLFCDETVLQFLTDTADGGGGEVEGRLRCYRCAAKLGHWNWSGAQCSCGTWVVPAIQIPISKVDAIVPRGGNNGDSTTTVAPTGTTTTVVMPRIFS